ncbi:MAG: hypothetical protein V9H25_18065 [Candidatus Competibacter sp.]
MSDTGSARKPSTMPRTIITIITIITITRRLITPNTMSTATTSAFERSV